EVRAGRVICIIEAMKMENEITAHRDGVITGLSVAPGQAVTTGQIICVVSQVDEEPPGPARSAPTSDGSLIRAKGPGRKCGRRDRQREEQRQMQPYGTPIG